jgi:opacity protein-like surface antigen
VRETIDDLDYRGYTDLTGLEAIYDVTKKWDIGIKGRMLHSWSADQYKYGTGLSLGYNLVKNVLIRVGYNITGFTDRDFSKADFTSEGPFIKLSLKFDQVSARSAVKWLTGQ